MQRLIPRLPFFKASDWQFKATGSRKTNQSNQRDVKNFVGWLRLEAFECNTSQNCLVPVLLLMNNLKGQFIELLRDCVFVAP